MQRLVLFTSVLLTACATASEPDVLDEITQDLEPAMPAWAEGNNFPDEETLEQLVRTYCGMSRDGVTTYKGLTGTYQRLGLTAVDEPVRLKLVTEHDEPDAKGTFTGTYTGANGQPVPYSGRFGAIPDNPAIGAAFVLDTNSDTEYDKLYFVLAIRRSFGLVRGLCLAGAERPFLLSRTTLF